MTYKGIVRGRGIELEGQVVLPEGTEVEVVVKSTKERSWLLAATRRVRPRPF